VWRLTRKQNRRMPSLRIAVLVGILPLILGMQCGPGRERHPGAIALPSSEVRLVSVPPPDSGRAWGMDFDAVLEESGRLHAAWSSFVEDSGRDDPWYTYSDGDDSPASNLRHVRVNGYDVRIVVTDSFVHLFVCEVEIRHLVLDRRAGSWREVARIGRPTETIGWFDVVENEGEMVLVYLAHSSRERTYRVTAKAASLVVVEFADDGAPRARAQWDFPHVDFISAGPRLSAWRGEFHLVCGMILQTSPDRPGTSGLVHAYRAERGGTWSLQDLRLFPEKFLSIPHYLDGLALTATSDRLFVFFSGVEGLKGSESIDGRHWSPALHLSKSFVEPGVSDAKNLVASADSGDVVVAWIDRGFDLAHEAFSHPRKSEECDAVAIVSHSRPATLASLAGGPLYRLTTPGHAVGAIVARSGGGRHEILWASDSLTADMQDELGEPRISVARLPTGASN
jgi:hypothetical protein